MYFYLLVSIIRRLTWIRDCNQGCAYNFYIGPSWFFLDSILLWHLIFLHFLPFVVKGFGIEMLFWELLSNLLKYWQVECTFQKMGLCGYLSGPPGRRIFLYVYSVCCELMRNCLYAAYFIEPKGANLYPWYYSSC